MEERIGHFVHVVELGVLDSAPRVVGVGGHPSLGGQFLQVGVVGQSEEEIRRSPVPDPKRRFLVHHRDGMKRVRRSRIRLMNSFGWASLGVVSDFMSSCR